MERSAALTVCLVRGLGTRTALLSLPDPTDLACLRPSWKNKNRRATKFLNKLLYFKQLLLSVLSSNQPVHFFAACSGTEPR